MAAVVGLHVILNCGGLVGLTFMQKTHLERYPSRAIADTVKSEILKSLQID